MIRDLVASVGFELGAAKAEACFLLACIRNAQRIVEVGSGQGFSTAYLARAALASKPTGAVIATELDGRKAKRAEERWMQEGVRSVIDLRVGDARETLMDCGGAVDFVLLDVWPEVIPAVLKRLIPQLSERALVCWDKPTALSDRDAGLAGWTRWFGLSSISGTLRVDDGLGFCLYSKDGK